MKTSKLTKVVSVIGMVALVGCSEPRVEFDSNVLLSAKLLSFEGVMDKYKEKFKYSSEKCLQILAILFKSQWIMQMSEKHCISIPVVQCPHVLNAANPRS